MIKNKAAAEANGPKSLSRTLRQCAIKPPSHFVHGLFLVVSVLGVFLLAWWLGLSYDWFCFAAVG